MDINIELNVLPNLKVDDFGMYIEQEIYTNDDVMAVELSDMPENDSQIN